MFPMGVSLDGILSGARWAGFKSELNARDIYLKPAARGLVSMPNGGNGDNSGNSGNNGSSSTLERDCRSIFETDQHGQVVFLRGRRIMCCLQPRE